MKLHLFTIFDTKAAAYNTPFAFSTTGQALRAFHDLVNDHQSTISKHPEDYQLWHAGEFDTDTGQLQSSEVKPIAHGTDFVAAGPSAVPLSVKRQA